MPQRLKYCQIKLLFCIQNKKIYKIAQIVINEIFIIYGVAQLIYYAVHNYYSIVLNLHLHSIR